MTIRIKKYSNPKSNLFCVNDRQQALSECFWFGLIIGLCVGAIVSIVVASLWKLFNI